jgi:hypothetical protein
MAVIILVRASQSYPSVAPTSQGGIRITEVRLLLLYPSHHLGYRLITKIRKEQEEITTKTKEFQMIIREYFQKLYSNKLENLEIMDKFLDTFDHPKLNQEDINHLNRSITLNEIEAAIKNLQDLMDSLLNSIRPSKKN